MTPIAPSSTTPMRQLQRIIIIEAVTSHGPISSQRKAELATLLAGATVQLVYITAFLSRKALAPAISTIAWETAVWIAEEPSHCIIFNGEQVE